MQRRRFIQVATASVLLPAAARASVQLERTPDYVFFDERFQKARRTAAAWSISSQPTAVHSDITPVWRDGLDTRTRAQSLHLRGVTTDSFLFCLRILAGEHADLDLQVSRLDRNLFQWRMYTTPKLSTERRHG